MKKSVLFITLYATLGVSQAHIYQCVDQNQVVYQDTPCLSGIQQNIVVAKPLVVPKKMTKKEQQQVQKQAKKVHREQQKAVRAHHKQQERIQIEQRKAKRLALRCTRLDHKIQRIESRLRAGYTIQRGQSLEERLHNLMREKVLECKDISTLR